MRTAFSPVWAIVSLPFRLIASIIKDFHTAFTAEAEESPVADALNKAIDQPQELLDHLNELRRHLLRSVLVLIITTAIGATFFEEIMALISRPLPGGTESLQIIEVTEPVSAFMRIALFTGFALAFPIIAMEIWLFVGPAIISRKRRIISLLTIPAATALFWGGVAFTYFLVLPSAVPFLLNIGNFQQAPRVMSYIKFVTGLCFWIGVLFEYPLVILVLASRGLVTARQLAQQWRLAIVIMAIVSALVTPTVDPVNMGLVMAPMFVLYLLGIVGAFVIRLLQKPE